jgi:hypothetical protein
MYLDTNSADSNCLFFRSNNLELSADLTISSKSRRPPQVPKSQAFAVSSKSDTMLDSKTESTLVAFWISQGKLPSVANTQRLLRCAQSTCSLMLTAFREKYPGIKDNSLYRIYYSPASTTTIKQLASSPSGTTAKSILAPSSFTTSKFGSKDQLIIDSNTHILFSLKDRKVFLLTVTVPSSTIESDIAICDQSASLVQRLMSFIQPLLSSSLWLCRWEREKGRDNLHLHLYISVKSDQKLPNKSILRQIWAPLLPAESFLKHFGGGSYSESDIEVDVRHFDTFTPDDFPVTYLSKMGPQARSYRYFDNEKISPQSRYHISNALAELSKDSVFTIKLPCKSETQADQFIADMQTNLPTPQKPWIKIENSYGRSKGLRTRYLAADVEAIKAFITKFTQDHQSNITGSRLDAIEDFVLVEAHVSGKVFIKRQHIKCKAEKAFNAEQQRKAKATKPVTTKVITAQSPAPDKSATGAQALTHKITTNKLLDAPKPIEPAKPISLEISIDCTATKTTLIATDLSPPTSVWEVQKRVRQRLQQQKEKQQYED